MPTIAGSPVAQSFRITTIGRPLFPSSVPGHAHAARVKEHTIRFFVAVPDCMVSDELTRMAGIAQVLIDATLANRDIQMYLADPRPPHLWTVGGVRRNPTCRVEWEHVVVIGGIGESLAAARHKNWGQFIGVLPLEPDDPVHWCRLLYLYKACSPYNRRVEQRKALKRILGRKHRSLVTQAARSTKKDFLHQLTEAGAFVIKRRLHLEPGQFWRAAKGRDFIELPTPPVQLLLFADDAGEV